MIDAVERLMNLALYLAAASEPVSAERIRVDVNGYSADQDDAAFLRMFERDKEDLRAAGFAIVSDDADSRFYRLDPSATFARSVDLTAEEAASVRVAGTALLGDASFPFADDLRLALAKIASAAGDAEVSAAARLADEHAEAQGRSVAELSSAATRRKRAAFQYTNSRGQSAPHDIEPYGLFLHDGRWYAVGRDVALDEVRTYTVSRMSTLRVNEAKPKSPDFERPADFDVRAFVRLPFQYGLPTDEFEAVVRFAPASAWRAASLAGGHGSLTPDGDAIVWRIRSRSRAGLLRFVVENGPGLAIVEPPALAEDLREGLAKVVRAHA